MSNNTATTRLLLLSILLFLAACGTTQQPISGCEPVDNITPVCKFKNPEDMALLPDQRTLIISQIGRLSAEVPGSLVFFDTASQLITPAFVLPEKAALDTSTNWGAASCPGRPGAEFSPLGISLRQRNDGRWQLAVANTGRHVSVEMFELLAHDQHYTLAWRGCVIPPEGSFLNDVALLRNGGFVASHMFDQRDPLLFGFSTGVWKAQLGINTGYVFEWLPEASTSFRVLADSHGPFMNGIQLSADENSVFVSVTSGNEVRKLDRASGKLLAAAKVINPDNLAWDQDGYLLAASLDGGKLDQLACFWHPGETCGLGFSIARINPESMASEKFFQHAGAPMGGATVAQQVGADLYLGSFTGDRIVKIPYARAAGAATH